MTWLRRLLALPLGFAFIFALPLALVALRFSGLVASPIFLRDQLRQNDVYSFLVQHVAPGLLEHVLAGGLLPADAPFSVTADDLRDVPARALPPDWVARTAETALDQVYPYVLGQTNGFTFQVDLADRKGALVQAISEVLQGKTQHVVDDLPECSVGRLSLAQASVNFPLCLPNGLAPDAFMAIWYPTWASGVPQSLQEMLPDKLSFTEADFPEEVRQSEGFDERGEAFALLRSSAMIFTAVVALLGVIASLLGGRALRSQLRWAGVLLTSGAALTAAFAVLLPIFTDAVLADLVASGPRDASPLIAEKTAAFTSSMTDAFFDVIEFQAVVLLIVGAAAVGTSFLPPRSRISEPAAPTLAP